eukprot:CAMPEP_0177660930 /NCGR_PEP_ID=MMETSP0447-20121125/18349_1 /TAXON_ID=0 /ORGANISM="Stygamoeba regulata, Strain BSH-02190019" /LENGTH=84 /DNA_ID=CAMNT_0019166121 /DNA_START=215 /DNA_END=466 /DNA_ORIENTATION=+
MTIYSDDLLLLAFIVKLMKVFPSVVLDLFVLIPCLAVKSRRVFPTYVGSIVLAMHLLLIVSLFLGGVSEVPTAWVCHDEFTLRT